MGKVITMPAPLGAVEGIIRKLAEDSANVHFTDHVSDQMNDRGITQTQAIACLRSGIIVEGPMLDSYNQKGWKVTMELFCAGRSIGVAAKLVERGKGYIIVITAF